MKKILSIALIFTLCFTLFACGDENNTDPTTTTTTQNSTTITTTLKAETTTAKPVVKYIYRISDGGAVITNVLGHPGPDVVIPETLDGHPVVGIEGLGFRNFCTIISVTIPSTIEYIDSSVFYGCENLTRVNISDLSAWIELDKEDDALANCKDVYLNGDKVEFSGDFVIPEGTKKIGHSAFQNCKDLTGVTIPDSVTSIGAFAFSGCENLFSITIPESVTTIREYAFMNCTKLETLNLLGSVSTMYDVFAGCENLKTINASNPTAWFESDFHPALGGTGTGSPLIYGADLYINGVKVDFSGNFVIPEGTKTIGNHTLGFSDEITSITIPSSVSKICGCAFDRDYGKRTNLKKVNITDLVAWCEIDFEYNWSIDFMGEEEAYEKGYYGTPLDSADLYLNGVKVDFSGDFAIPEGTKKIGDLAFCDFDEMTSATIPSSVTSIGKLSFAGCDNLKSVTIPDSVTSIEDCAFTDCYNVTIHAKKGSYAYKYATDNNINVVALD